MLPRFSEAGKKIQLNVGIYRRLGKANLVPCLRRGPPAGFAMVESLLVQREAFQLSRDTLEAIRVINLGVNVLDRLQKPIFICVTTLGIQKGLQGEESPSVFPAVNSSLGDELGIQAIDELFRPANLLRSKCLGLSVEALCRHSNL